MRLSQSVRYAVMCLFELAKLPVDYFQADALARSLDIPPAYAHKVLQAMAHAGLVVGVKGSGYKLARPLAHISALEVIEALTKEPSSMNFSDVGFLLERRINEALGKCSLAELNATI